MVTITERASRDELEVCADELELPRVHALGHVRDDSTERSVATADGSGSSC